MKWKKLDKRARLQTEEVPENLTMRSVYGIENVTFRKMVGHAKIDRLENQGMVDIADAAGAKFDDIAKVMRQGRRELEQRAKAEGVSSAKMRERIRAEAESDPVRAALAEYSRRAVIETFVAEVNGEELAEGDYGKLNNEVLDVESAEWVCSRALVIGKVVKETKAQSKNA